MKHKEHCDKSFDLYEALRADYEQSYPNYCKKCNGWGGSYSKYDPSPSGIALSPGYMEEFDLCPHCLEQSICPRCGNSNIFMDEDNNYKNTCGSCGFVEGESEGRPIEPECWCCFGMPESIFDED